MKQLRSILVIISFCVFGIGAISLNILVFPFAKMILNKDNYQRFASKIIQSTWSWLVWFLSAIRLIKVNVKNKEKLADIQGGKVIVSTHPSFIDIVILLSLIPHSTCFVKSKLADNFVFQNIVKSIFITNDTDLDEVKDVTKDFLDKGFNIIVFPMGSRHRKNEFPKIKKGASLIALNSQKDIIPIKITESEDFLFVNQPFWQGGKKSVCFDIEVLDEIKINRFDKENEIVAKKEITKEIAKSLYNE